MKHVKQVLAAYLLPFAVSLAILLIGVSVEKMPLERVVIAVLALTVSATVALLLASAAITGLGEAVQKMGSFVDHVSKLDEATKRTQNLVTLLPGYNSSVITKDDLLEIERNVNKNAHIWVLTSGLILEETELKPIILANLRQNVRYIYLIPDAIRDRFDGLTETWRDELGANAEKVDQVRCVLVPEHVVYMTVVVYGANTGAPIVVVKLPSTEAYSGDEYGLIYKVTQPTAVKPFTDALRQLVDRKSSNPGQCDVRAHPLCQGPVVHTP